MKQYFVEGERVIRKVTGEEHVVTDVAVTEEAVTITGGASWSSGTGTPEGAVTGNVGDIFSRTDGGSGTSLYIKESGTGNTGWVAK